MFEARFEDTTKLKVILEAIETVRDGQPVVLRASGRDGIKVSSMSPTPVAMLDMHLTVELFDFWRCDEDVEMGVVLRHLIPVLQKADSGRVTLRKEPNRSHLEMLVEEEGSDTILQCKVNLVSMDSEEITVPDSDQRYQVEADMTSARYAKMIEVLSVAHTDESSATVNFSCDGQEELKINVGSDGSLATGYSFGRDSDIQWVFLATSGVERVSVRYQVKWLKKFAKSVIVADTVQIGFQDNYPLKLHVKLPYGSHLTYYLAPSTS